jgi:hypothetical protein
MNLDSQQNVPTLIPGFKAKVILFVSWFYRSRSSPRRASMGAHHRPAPKALPLINTQLDTLIHVMIWST